MNKSLKSAPGVFNFKAPLAPDAEVAQRLRDLQEKACLQAERLVKQFHQRLLSKAK